MTLPLSEYVIEYSGDSYLCAGCSDRKESPHPNHGCDGVSRYYFEDGTGRCLICTCKTCSGARAEELLARVLVVHGRAAPAILQPEGYPAPVEPIDKLLDAIKRYLY